MLVQALSSIVFYNNSKRLQMVSCFQPIAPHLARTGSAWIHAHQALTHVTFTASACYHLHGESLTH